MIKKSNNTGELRKFGLVMACALGLAAGLFFIKGRAWAPAVAGAAMLFLVLGVVRPLLLQRLHQVWMTIAEALGFVMTRVILAVLFYLVITPIGVIARLTGRDFLAVKMPPSSTAAKNEGSYWVEKKKTDSDVSRWEKQY